MQGLFYIEDFFGTDVVVDFLDHLVDEFPILHYVVRA